MYRCFAEYRIAEENRERYLALMASLKVVVSEDVFI